MLARDGAHNDYSGDVCRWIVSGEAEFNGRSCQSLRALFASPTNHPRKLSEKVPKKARQSSCAWAFAARKLNTLGMLPVVPGGHAACKGITQLRPSMDASSLHCSAAMV